MVRLREALDAWADELRNAAGTRLDTEEWERVANSLRTLAEAEVEYQTAVLTAAMAEAGVSVSVGAVTVASERPEQ